MPEGHSVHRIARQFRVNFVGTRPSVSSPQGRFAQGAAVLDHREMTDSRAVGKHLFLEFEERDWLRVHLGIYGAWDFSGNVQVDPSIQMHGADRRRLAGGQVLGRQGDHPRHTIDIDAEDSVTSIGAPRRTRMRMAEQDSESEDVRSFPPEPVGQVRVRLVNDSVCADLRGPTACEVLTPDQVEAVLNRLGPDPANVNTEAERHRFIARASKKRSPIGLVLMDQSVVAGIGNVYRAELLFRAGIDPHAPADQLSEHTLGELWDDWAVLLNDGISVGQMITIDGLDEQAYQRALRQRKYRNWVYKHEGTPCKRCGTNIALETMANRKLYWCPGCQRAH